MKVFNQDGIELYNGDVRATLRTLPDATFNTCVTSPPYFGLRDYGVDGQLGLEPTPEQYVANMVEVFREVRRCLRDDGTLWLNIGDSYNNAGSSRNGEGLDGKQRGGATGAGGECGYKKRDMRHALKGSGIKHKDLMGIPWMLAFALRADGWYLRQDIIWHKPNPMPESVTDRCTKAHEYVFLLSKSDRYFYDGVAVAEQAVGEWTYDQARRLQRVKAGGGALSGGTGDGVSGGTTRNKRSVWTINVNTFAGAHFATFPEDLVIPCIKAGSPEGGNVLEPFAGSGTTLKVARDLGRRATGIELNPAYCEIVKGRFVQPLLFQPVPA